MRDTQTQSPTSTMKDRFRSVLRFCERTTILRFIPRTVRGVYAYLKLPGQHSALVHDHLTLNHHFIESQVKQQKLIEDVRNLYEQIRVLKQDLRTVVANIESARLPTPLSVTQTSKPALLRNSIEQLYEAYEQRFRGTSAEVTQKQSQYLPRIFALSPEISKLPICDIGCGRGEWLALLKLKGLPTIGIEPNRSMAHEAQLKGLEIESCNGDEFLSKVQENSLAGISSFHVVEHIPFEDVFSMLQKAQFAIAPGGFILLETPNPENILVGSCQFYADPTHLKPIPPETLRFFVERAGFINVEIIRSSPIRTDVTLDHPRLQEMADRFYGPQDYAIWGTKP